MEMDTRKLGEVVAKLMHSLNENSADLEIGTVAIVVEARRKDPADPFTQVEIECSDPRVWVTKGLLAEGISVIEASRPLED